MNLVPARQGERLRLGMRNLYIVPTRFGWLWLAGAVVLHVVGIQMQANGPLLLSFLLLGLFLLALHLTHFNLQGLDLRCGEPLPGFAGQPVPYPLRVTCPSRCEGLRLRFGRDPLGPPRALAQGEHWLPVPWTPARRGLQRPGCLRLQTSAPLGLFVCWSRWEPQTPQLILPARRPGPVLQVRRTGDAGTAAAVRADPPEGTDEWLDLRPHRPEDGTARLAWKLLAQGRGRHAKRFADPAPASLLLAPDPAVPFEEALEHLSERIWQLHGQGLSYGVQLPDRCLPAGQGTAHRDQCLAALALCR